MRNIGRGFGLVTAIGLLLGTVQAGTIMVVSDCQVPGVAEGDHNDDSLVTFLTGLGHTVDTSGMNGAMKEGTDGPWGTGPDSGAKLQALNDADLIIVSRKTNSGAYDNTTEKHAWNELATPLIMQSGYLTRGGSTQKWGWTTTNSGDAANAVTDMVVTDMSHPFVSGFAADVAMFDWTKDNGDPGTAPKTLYLPLTGTSTFRPGTTQIATFDDKPMLFEIAAGTDLDEGGALKYGTTGGPRAFLGHWGYDDGPTGTNGSDGGPSDWADYLTDDYKTVFGNMVNTMVAPVPEPGTITMVVTGLLGMMLYGCRRRRS